MLMVPLEPNSEQCQGVNMDCVYTLLMFMERRLESVRAKATLLNEFVVFEEFDPEKVNMFEL